MSRAVFLVTIALDGVSGGLERNFVRLANHLAKEGRIVHVVTFDRPGARAFYALDSSIVWHQTGQSTPHMKITFSERLKLLLNLRNAFKRSMHPQIICFHHGVLPRVLLASVGLAPELICSERNSLELYRYVNNTRKWSLGFLCLAFVRAITVQFPRYIDDYPFWLRSKISVVHNPVYVPDRAFYEPGCRSRKTVLNVGRLCTQKNQLMLIGAFAKIAARFPDWDMVLVGNGNLESALKSEAERFGITDRVLFVGQVQDVGQIYEQADLFVMPSQWEGFPNALAEAMSFGLPAVGLSACAGVRDLIHHEGNGLLTTPEELPKTLSRLMSDAELRSKMGMRSREIILQYSPELAYKAWSEVLSA